MKKYDYIAFDLDGTLTDPAKGLVEGFVYALSGMGVDYGEREALRRFIGPPLFDEWQSEFGFTPEESARAIEIFREYYDIYGWWDNKPYDGIHDLLDNLKRNGKILAVATSKPEETAKRVLSLFSLDKYFDFIAGAASGTDRRTKEEVIEYCLQSLGSPDKSKCIIVGDRKYDAEGARKCGIDALGVLWGHGDKEELDKAGFVAVLKSPKEVLEFLK